MFRQRLLIASAVCSLACSQLAGFDQLSSRTAESPGGEGGSAGASDPTAGTPARGGRESGEGGEGGDTSQASAGESTSGGSPGVAGSGGSPGGASANGGAGGMAAAAGSAGLAPLGACNTTLLRNGYFDDGSANWRQESTATSVLQVSDVILEDTNPKLIDRNLQPKSPHYLAWIGAKANPNKSTRVNLLQPVQIPLNVSKILISGWVQIQTEEDVNAPDPDIAFDRLDLALQDPDPDSDDFWSLGLWYFTDATAGWLHFNYEHDDADFLNQVRGRVLDFVVEGKYGKEKDTIFWVDSLDLVARCPVEPGN